jgi:hypothetical protein
LCGKVKIKVVSDAESATLIPMVEGWVEKGAIIVTDEWSAYNPLGKNYLHIRVNHLKKEYVNGAFTTNGVENFWSLLKKGIRERITT